MPTKSKLIPVRFKEVEFDRFQKFAERRTNGNKTLTVKLSLQFALAVRFESKYLEPLNRDRFTGATETSAFRLREIDLKRVSQLWESENPDRGRAIRSAINYAMQNEKRFCAKFADLIGL